MDEYESLKPLAASHEWPRSAGHAGINADSQLTLRVDHSMNPGQCCGEHRYWRSLS